MLSTLITRREQFHDARIGERITAYDPAVQQRLAAMQQHFIGQRRGLPSRRMTPGIGALKRSSSARRSSWPSMTPSSSWPAALSSAALLVWFCKKPDPRPVRATE